MIIQILGLIVIGAVIGVLARLLRPGRQHLSMLATVLVGIVSALIGGFIVKAFDKGSWDELNFWGFVLAVVLAVILVPVAESISAKNDNHHRVA